MAYMNQEKKAKIAAELKGIIPKDWKYSLGVNNHSTIALTISAAPIDILEHMYIRAQELARPDDRNPPKKGTYAQVNQYHLKNEFTGELFDIFQKINKALNLNNYNNSDSMTDYFDVGHYVDINIGKWDKPFVFISQERKAA